MKIYIRHSAEGAGVTQEEFILESGLGRLIVYSALVSNTFKREYFDFWIYDKEPELKADIPEGTPKQSYITTYSRNRAKREEAIQKHGRDCKVYGFNFDLFYGVELARGYVETHHLTPVSVLSGNGSTEQVPVCPNCHRMLHRSNPVDPISVKELVEILRDQGSLT